MWSNFRKKSTGPALNRSKQESLSSPGPKEEIDLVHDKSHHAGPGRYINPWPSATTSSWLPNSFAIPLTWAGKPRSELRRIGVVKPDFEKEVAPNELKATWLGHAGVLVQMPPLKKGTRGFTLCIDPIFSQRASPSSYAGPGRYLGNPCQVEDLPFIDFLFISHNHYDHLDYTTMMKIIQKGGEATRYVIPLGVKQWFLDSKVPEDQIIELDWWEETTFQPSDIYSLSSSVSYSPEELDELDTLGSLRISCVPAQHNSARTGLDKCTTLWAGFVIEQFACKPSKAPCRTTVYFAGDTGYRAEAKGPVCPAFEQIGRRYGPMDFSAIPIWRGGTLNFVSYIGVRIHPEALTLATHATPEDAVSIHADVLSRSTLAIHYATFAGSEDEATYPIALLEEACKNADIEVSMSEDDGFGVSDVGETLAIPVRPDVVYKDAEEQTGV